MKSHIIRKLLSASIPAFLSAAVFLCVPVSSVRAEETAPLAEEDTGDGELHGMGLLPTPLEYEIPVVGDVSSGGLRLRSAPLPATYNSYAANRLPAVRDQNTNGACWAFAILGAMEADLIHDGYADRSIDLSELHLVWYSTHSYADPEGCRTDTVTYRTPPQSSRNWIDNGGNGRVGAELLMNRIGAVYESDVPYSAGAGYAPSDASAWLMSQDKVQLRDAYFVNSSDRSGIKAAIRDHGGVLAPIGYNSSCYNSENNSYYRSDAYSNHAVVLVGWDDSFPKECFNTTPPEDGAWLARNSWGTDGYDIDGYFWVSYADGGMRAANLNYVIACDAEAVDLFDHCYAYDGMPAYSSTCTVASGSSLSVDYTVHAGEAVRAVGVEIGTANTTLSVSVKNNTTGEEVQGSKTTTYAGLYTIPLDNVLNIDADASVTVTITNGSGAPIEIVTVQTGNIGPYGDLLFTSVCDQGYRLDGVPSTDNRDARVKLYTSNTISGAKVLTLTETAVSGHWGETAQLSFSAGSDPGVQITDLSWTSSNTDVAAVDGNGRITMGARRGTATITGTYAATGQKIRCTATVSPYHITYHLTEEDAVYQNLSDEFYPGDPDYGTLPTEVYRSSGYVLANWCSDEARTQAVPATLTDNTWCRDLDLYPAWQPFTYDVRYYVPNTDLTGSTGTVKVIRDSLSAAELPWNLPDAAHAQDNPNRYASTYNQSHPPKAFQYWSRDAAGSNRVDTVTQNDFPLKQNHGQYSYSAGAQELIFYPQYGDSGEAVPVTSVTLDRTNLSMYTGESAKLTATVLPVYATETAVTWSSGDNGIATVTADGTVTAVSAGTVTVTAACGGKSAACTVTVMQKSEDPVNPPEPEPEDPVEAFVRRLYPIVLGRDPDAAGMNSWVQNLKSGASTGADVARGFYLSNEVFQRGLDNGAYVDVLYLGMLDRAADEQGRASWIDMLENGISLEAAVAGFANSEEFAALCDRYGITQGTLTTGQPRDQNPGVTRFVCRLYTQALGRSYDVTGLNDWTGRILDDPSKDNILYVSTTGFLNSQEFLGKNLDNAAYVHVLYHTYLDRDPDEGGFNDWMARLNAGEDRNMIAAGFAASPEFENIMKSCGLF